MNSNWIDILPPIPPAEATSGGLWMLVITTVLLVVFFYLWLNSARQKSLRKLNTLQSQSKEANDIAFIISETVKQRFKVNNINHIHMQDKNTWERYKRQLATFCYSAHKPSITEIDSLLNETRYWVKQRANKNA